MDIYRKIDSYRGYIYCIRRTMVGTVCCYIDVSHDKRFRSIVSACNKAVGSKISNWAGFIQEDIDKLLNVPGGITYAALGFPRHIIGKRELFDKDFVIGYDYGHYNDINMFSHYGGSFNRMLPSDIKMALWSMISEMDAEKALHRVIDQLV